STGSRPRSPCSSGEVQARRRDAPAPRADRRRTGMDLVDYYDKHWTELPEGDVDWDRLQMIVSRVRPGDLVLEAGCGPGFLAKLLKDRGARVIGTDVSQVGARRTAARGIETHHVDLDTMRLPF